MYETYEQRKRRIAEDDRKRQAAYRSQPDYGTLAVEVAVAAVSTVFDTPYDSGSSSDSFSGGGGDFGGGGGGGDW